MARRRPKEETRAPSARRSSRAAPGHARVPEPTAAPSTELVLEEDGLVYVLDELPRKGAGRVLITVRSTRGEGTGAVRDLTSLYAQRGREALGQLIAETFGREIGQILGHLDLFLDQIDRAAGAESRVATVTLDAPRRRAAERLLLAPDLLDRAATTIAELGYVGEERVKRLTYLVATSRLLAKPLSAILVAPLSSGKSELLERVVQMLPEESVEFLSRLTPQALFYAGGDYLAHKVIVVDEQAGAVGAEYPIRTLQSRGVLRLTVTVKGRIESREAKGPIALLSSTTRHDLHPENLSRCLELPLDDGPEQTERVFEAQRNSWAGGESQPVNLRTWQDAQRLLEPSSVVIPFARQLTYRARTSKDRRDHAKLGSLIAAHALLHGRQRERDDEGRIVARVADYRAIYQLIRLLADEEIDGLSPRAARAYRHLCEAPRGSSTRRQLANALGWSYATAARAVCELEAHELVVSTGARPHGVRVLDRSLLGEGASLKPPGDIEGAK